MFKEILRRMCAPQGLDAMTSVNISAGIRQSICILTLLRRVMSEPFFRFLFVGLVNTVFGYSVYVIATFVGLKGLQALIAATVCAVLFNFKTTGHFVFNSKRLDNLFRYFFANAIIFLVNALLLKLLTDCNIGQLLAQAYCLLAIVPFSFFIMKYYVFRKRNDK